MIQYCRYLGFLALLFVNYGSQQRQLLKAAGVDVAYVIPKEGALAWSGRPRNWRCRSSMVTVWRSVWW